MKLTILFLATALLFACSSTAWKLNIHGKNGKVLRYERKFGFPVKCYKIPGGPIDLEKVFWDPRNAWPLGTTTGFMVKESDNCEGADGISVSGKIGGSKPETMRPRQTFNSRASMSNIK
jgi:hypothetical protein